MAVGKPSWVAALHAAPNLFFKPLGLCAALWNRKAWHQVLLLKVHLATLCYQQGVVCSLRDLREKTPHLTRALEVKLLGLKLEPLWVVKVCSGLHTKQGLMGNRVLLVDIVEVIGAH